MTTKRGTHGRRGTGRAAAWAACLLITSALAVPGHADVLTVDVDGGGQFTSILPAMINADNGDTILVAPGVYTGPGNHDLDFEWKNLVIVSSGGAEETIIDPGGETGFLLTGQQTQAAVIAGFTITNAGGEPYEYGPIFIQGGAATIRDCNFVGNHKYVYVGPGFSMSIRGCRFSDNHSRGLFASVDAPELAIASCTFEGNHGCALRLESAGPNGAVTVDSCSFLNNFDQKTGGAVSADGENIVIRDCVFTGNQSQGEGGAVVIGGPYSAPGSGTEITRCVFSGNSAQTNGGAIARKRINVTVSECTFERNHAAKGGAIRAHLDAPETSGALTILNCTFTENFATMGAGVMCEASAPEIGGCLFDSNRAWLWGGGVCANGSHDEPPLITYCTFTRNRAHRGAALLANDGAELTAEHCTFYGCGGDDGTIVSLVEGVIYLSNSILSFAPRGVPVHLQFGTATIEHCVVFGNAGGDSLPAGNPDNLFTDPLFCNVYDDDFTLCNDSPCHAPNNAWGEPVGARGLGCGDCGSSVEAVTWGRIKAMYR